MNKFKLLFFLLLTCSIAVSCGDDEESGGFECSSITAVNQQLEDELNALNDAIQAYASDPENSAKCTEWKNAYLNYLNALEGFEDCYLELGQQAQFQESLDAAEAAIASIPC